jgi:hypothetical protein
MVAVTIANDAVTTAKLANITRRKFYINVGGLLLMPLYGL